jgi:hypothetical protein
MTQDAALALLKAADVFYGTDEDDPSGKWDQTINFNDTWAWATAWGEYVPDDELVNVATLFYQYGWCGILYWMSERHEQMMSEFHDINRFIEFVRIEEGIKKEILGSSARAYAKRSYVIGQAKEGRDGE